MIAGSRKLVIEEEGCGTIRVGPIYDFNSRGEDQLHSSKDNAGSIILKREKVSGSLKIKQPDQWKEIRILG